MTEQTPATSRRRTRPSSDLVSLAGPLFELVLKLRAGSIAPGEELRPAFKQLLQEMEQRGTNLRYSESQVKAVKFALAAFVDETVLSTNFPLREEWEKYPLQLEYFGEHLAGVSFFEKLDELLKRIETEADVVEVFYVCLLLGFKGKYKVYMEDQLQTVIESVAGQLRRVGRLQERELSPHWKVTDQPAVPKDKGFPIWVKLGCAFGVTIVIFIYIILFFLLRSELNAAKEQLLH